MQRATWTTYAQLFAGMAIFGSGTPVSKIVTQDFPVFLASGLRMALAAAVLLPLALRGERRRDLARLDGRDRLVLGGVAVVGMFGFSVFMLYGMRQVSGVVGSIVMSTTPAVTALASFLFLRDRLGWRQAAGVALAVLGVLLVNLGGGVGTAGGGNLLLGTLLVFLAVCGEAGYTLLGKVATGRLAPVAIAGVSAALAVVLFLPFALWQLRAFEPAAASARGWLVLTWWGVGTMALGSVLWYRGVERVSGTTAAGFMGVMPVSALVLSYALLGEPFAWAHLVGFAVVFAGVGFIAWSHAGHARHEERAADERDGARGEPVPGSRGRAARPAARG